MTTKLSALSLLLLLAFSPTIPAGAATSEDVDTKPAIATEKETADAPTGKKDRHAHKAAADGKKISQFQGPGANAVQNPSFDPDVNPSTDDHLSKKAKSEPVNMDGILKRAVTHFPRTAASFTAGVFLGTPVAMVRKSKEEVVSMAKDITDNSKNPLYLGLAGSLALPFGAWAGTLDGAISSMKNSALYSVDRPFSKDSFSLGDLR
jgi:hypothetical protein